MSVFDAPAVALSAISSADAVYAVIVVLLGYTVLGASGFGSALVIVPLLAWRWPLALVVPLVLLLDAPAAGWHARLNLENVNWRELVALLPGVGLGMVVAWAVPGGDFQPVLLGLLGIYVLGVSLRGFMSPLAAPVRRTGWPFKLSLGAAAGWVETTFGTSGPLFAAWFSQRLADQRAARATIPVALVGASLLALGGMAVQGRLHVPLLWAALPVLLVVALIGVYVGHRVAAGVDGRRLTEAIFVLLGISGLSLVARAATTLLA